MSDRGGADATGADATGMHATGTYAARAEPPRPYLACAGCGAVVPPGAPFTPACPARRPGDDIDHVLVPHLDPAAVSQPGEDPHAADPNPFVRYRGTLHAWHVARAAGWSDDRFVALVRELDAAVAAVDGHGFGPTPFGRADELSSRLGFALEAGGGIWVKDETGDVGGSHKARHLFGIMLELRVAEALGPADPARPLAIASCGNAALAAAIVARAAARTLLVFVPESADPVVLARLHALGADVRTCRRRPGEAGDPSVLRMREALAAGAVPFTCQGDENGFAIEGGATLGLEILDAAHAAGWEPDRLVLQVGGGAFASGQALAVELALAAGVLRTRPRFDTVQTAGGWPLARAFARVTGDFGLMPGAPPSPDRLARDLVKIAHHRARYMWPWESEPHSVAHGILDDETYDWLAVMRAMLVSGGRPVVVDETTLREANILAGETTGIPADHTGTSGLAGLLQLVRERAVSPGERVVVIFSGVRRSAGSH